MRRSAQSLVALLLLTSILTTPAAHGAAPRVIVIEGHGLVRPVVLDDWEDNHRFLLGLRDIDGEVSLSPDRPQLDLQMFWGPEVDAFITAGGDPKRLTAEKLGGRQVARQYLASDDSPLVLDYAGSLHELTSEAKAVLEEWGIPLQAKVVEGGNQSSAGIWWLALATVGGIAVALTVCLTFLVSRQR